MYLSHPLRLHHQYSSPSESAFLAICSAPLLLIVFQPKYFGEQWHANRCRVRSQGDERMMTSEKCRVNNMHERVNMCVECFCIFCQQPPHITSHCSSVAGSCSLGFLWCHSDNLWWLIETASCFILSLNCTYKLRPTVGQSLTVGERRGKPLIGRHGIPGRTYTETNNHSHSHAESPIILTPACMLLDCGRKPEYPEKTHTYTGRTCKLRLNQDQKPAAKPGTSYCEAPVLPTTSRCHPIIYILSYLIYNIQRDKSVCK